MDAAMNDEDLVEKFRNGEHEAFAVLVERYSKPLTMMVLKMIKDPEEAKDISQTAFLKAYESIRKLSDSSSFKTWLFSIAANAVKDHFRKRRPSIGSTFLEELPDPASSVSDQIDNARLSRKLGLELDKLPPKQRMTVLLRVYEQLSYDEIAEVMGGSPGAARGNFFQAAKKLGEALRSKDEKE